MEKALVSVKELMFCLFTLLSSIPFFLSILLTIKVQPLLQDGNNSITPSSGREELYWLLFTFQSMHTHHLKQSGPLWLLSLAPSWLFIHLARLNNNAHQSLDIPQLFSLVVVRLDK